LFEERFPLLEHRVLVSVVAYLLFIVLNRVQKGTDQVAELMRQDH